MIESLMSIGPVIGIVLGVAFAVLVVLSLEDQRGKIHLKVAERLIAEGVPKTDAMKRSGASHWDQSFMSRFIQKWPPLPTEQDEC
ncbi:hypothetical protein ALQ53_200197 [Pseudomonas cannabina]|uniref:Uncharacterized protein n=1 Tax=Pseudomonas cannabina TaxID=86840 RepID=A0AB37Q3W7_PSECA|nr:hypothetical protein [Pseudomonas cannabina]RMN76659.1 hypothetical protein ALQ53_200197 [Pseudomonas cannabina]